MKVSLITLTLGEEGEHCGVDDGGHVGSQGRDVGLGAAVAVVVGHFGHAMGQHLHLPGTVTQSSGSSLGPA